MKKLINFLFAICFTCQAFGQQPQLLQERNYLVKNTFSQIMGSTQDPQGNVYFSGSTWIGVSRWDNYFLKIKPNTDTIWTRRSAIKMDNSNHPIVALPNGDMVAGANIEVNRQVVTSLQNINSNGNVLWSRQYSNSRSNSILVLPGNDLILGGWYGTKNFTFTRIGSSGNVKWSKGYPWGQGNDAILDIKFTSKGKIVAAGGTAYPIGPFHLKLMVVDQKGDSIKGKQIVVAGFNRTETMTYDFNSVTPLTDGGFLVTASVDTITAAYPNGSYMGMIVKVDSSLNVAWKYIHRTPTLEEYKFTKSIELVDGSIIVLGFKIRPNPGSNSFQLYRFSPNGQLMNVYPFTSSICNNNWAVTLDALPNSTFMIGGRCGNLNPETYGFYVAKVSIPGLPAPLPPYTVTATKEDLAINGAGLGQSYPNPTAASANIPYTLPQHYTKASILIREIATGREIKRYELKRNSSSLNVDLSQLSNGLYLYSLVVDEQPVATKKLAVMK